MMAETIKIPEPIIEPATSMVASSKPSPRTNFSSITAGVAVMLSFKRVYPLACRVPLRNIVWKAAPFAYPLRRRAAIFEKESLRWRGRHRQHAMRAPPGILRVVRFERILRHQAAQIDVAIRCRARGRAFASG